MTEKEKLRGEIEVLLTFLRQERKRLRKSLGQNFLLDSNLLLAMVKDAGLTSRDVVLEVGTGPGLLTRLLAERAHRVISVETDREMLRFARGRLEGHPGLELVGDDILRGKRQLSPVVVEKFRRALCGQEGLRGKMVANLPYSIATPIILTVLKTLPEVESLLVMTQRELGDRLLSAVGTKDYGPARIILDLVATARAVRPVPPHVFTPRPKVHSVILEIKRREVPLFDLSSLARLDGFLCQIFTQRRKTLRAILTGRSFLGRGVNVEEIAGPVISRRPEELTPPELSSLFVALTPFLP